MKSLVVWIAAGIVGSAIIVALIVVFSGPRVGTISVSGDSRYVDGYAYDLTVSVEPLIDGKAALWERADDGEWTKVPDKFRVEHGTATLTVTPTANIAGYRVEMGRKTSEPVSMTKTPLTLTASGPTGYYPGLPVSVDVTTDPPVSDHADLWRSVGGVWTADPVPVPIAHGAARVTVYPGGDGQYKFSIGDVTTDVVAMTPDTSIPAAFAFRGGGWGHGVGMSQYGAAAMALHGYTASQILTHYYTGSRVEMLPVTGSEDPQGDATVRVQVFGSGDDSKTDTTLRVRSAAELDTGAWTLTFFTASSKPILDGGAPRVLTGTKDQDIAISASGSTVTATANGVSASGGIAVLTWAGTTYQDPGSTETSFVGIVGPDGASASNGTYRHGELIIGTAGGKRLNIVNLLKVNTEYLWGIAEVPSSWPTAALEAQAIAARNYAMANRAYKASCDCQLYDDTRSQNFTGWTKESQGDTGQWGARWVAAVNATASDDRHSGMMLTYGAGGAGNLVTAYYFSSSGGQTENSENVWSATVSYLRSVPDPWAALPQIVNPNADWTATIDQVTLAATFGLPDVVRVEIVSRTGPGTDAGVTALRATSSTGATSTLTGMEKIRTKLGLKSAWVKGIAALAVEG
jgi:stage II sporulation protein D